MTKADNVSLVRVGNAIVLMVEVYPTAFMLALTPTQAMKLAESLDDFVVGDKSGNDGDVGLLERLLKNKKPEGQQ